VAGTPAEEVSLEPPRTGSDLVASGWPRAGVCGAPAADQEVRVRGARHLDDGMCTLGVCLV